MVDELLAGLLEARVKGHWRASEASEERRLALLPVGPVLQWDSLMAHPDYMRALDLIP